MRQPLCPIEHPARLPRSRRTVIGPLPRPQPQPGPGFDARAGFPRRTTAVRQWRRVRAAADQHWGKQQVIGVGKLPTPMGGFLPRYVRSLPQCRNQSRNGATAAASNGGSHPGARPGRFRRLAYERVARPWRSGQRRFGSNSPEAPCAGPWRLIADHMATNRIAIGERALKRRRTESAGSYVRRAGP